jgi:hypothetical protein
MIDAHDKSSGISGSAVSDLGGVHDSGGMEIPASLENKGSKLPADHSGRSWEFQEQEQWF